LVIELPSVQSPDDKAREISRDINILTVNQRLKMGNYNPIGEEGDVPETIFIQRMQNQLQLEMQQKQAEIQQQMQPQQPQPPEGQVADDGSQEQEADVQQQQMEGQPEETAEQPSQFQSNVIGEVLRSLGVDPDSIPKTSKGFLLPTCDAACAMIDLTNESRMLIRDLGLKINADDLAENGLETDPHVTVLHGIYDSQHYPGAWRKTTRSVVSKVPEFELTTGQLKAFRAEQTGKDYDVLYLEVFSPNLNRLHSQLKNEVPVYETHPNYTPHATIAYLKPGTADKYIHSLGQQKPIRVRCHEVLFCDCNRNKTRLPLSKRVGKSLLKKSIHGDKLDRFLKAEKPRKISAPSPSTKKIAATSEPPSNPQASSDTPKVVTPAPVSVNKTIAASPEPHNDQNVVRTDNVAEQQDTSQTPNSINPNPAGFGEKPKDPKPADIPESTPVPEMPKVEEKKTDPETPESRTTEKQANQSPATSAMGDSAQKPSATEPAKVESLSPADQRKKNRTEEHAKYSSGSVESYFSEEEPATESPAKTQADDVVSSGEQAATASTNAPREKIDRARSGHWAYIDPSTGKTSYLPKDKVGTRDEVEKVLFAAGIKDRALKSAMSSLTDVDELAAAGSQATPSGGESGAAQPASGKPLSYREFLSKHKDKGPDEIGRLWGQYQDSVNNPKPPAFSDFATKYLDENPDAGHEEAAQAYRQAYPSKPQGPQESEEQPDIRNVGADQSNKDNTVELSLHDMELPYVPLEDEKAIPVARSAKRKLGDRAVVDRVLGTASASDISQLKDWKDWGKFISAAVVMGVARKHALGMFSAKSLILHVLSGFAFHLFNQATKNAGDDNQSAGDDAEPIREAKIIPTAKPIDTPVTGSTATIRNKQEDANRRARENYTRNVMQRKQAGQDISDTEGPKKATQKPLLAKPAVKP
jgi:hypothetical protein